MPPRSSTHLVLIPSYNTGPILIETVKAALSEWKPVWVVIDGSNDGSEVAIQTLAENEPDLRVIVHATNQGKGAAVATGVRAALLAGFTHVLTLDSDGQHPIDHIKPFMARSKSSPQSAVLGKPVFGPEVPLERLYGRKLSIGLAAIEILGRGIDDSLFGFRVYPAAALASTLHSTRWARGFDFDPEVVVRMFWYGTPTINLPAPCRYVDKAEGGISHFHYLRDNLRLIWLHCRLVPQLIWRWPSIRQNRRHASAS
jgi:glycosyltransferase involved in cell wall biosynthesis|uniref:glycosyltransferase family 2 protein n=1 Tax=Rheinheimera sp. TaxID=1869214 RepID=UPI0040472A38